MSLMIQSIIPVTVNRAIKYRFIRLVTHNNSILTVCTIIITLGLIFQVYVQRLSAIEIQCSF